MLNDKTPAKRLMFYALGAGLLISILAFSAAQPHAWAQDAGSPSEAAPPDAGAADTQPPADDASNTQPESSGGLNLFKLLIQGGYFMIPLLALSILVVTIVVERFISLRANRVLPPELVHALGQLGGPQGAFDPRKAYKVCQQFPSAASNVIRSMLLKVGRPHSEVEHAVAEASEREANRLYSVVKWLSLSAAIAPLIGLLGTVWGMIRAFHDTTLLDASANKAEALAAGIYTALVTTLCGLVIAIPAAIFAHFFENRITNLFHEIDEMLFNLMPQVERFEGKVRFGRQGADGGIGGREPPVHAEASEPRPAAATPK